MVGLPQGIHLVGFRSPAVIPGQEGKGHLQAEAGAAGNAQLLEAEDRIHAAGDQCEKEQSIDGESSVEQLAQAVHQLVAAQQCGQEHGEHLGEDHKPQTVFRNHPGGEHGAGADAEHHQQQIQYDGHLQREHALVCQLIVPLFRSGDDLFPQFPQTCADGNGFAFRLFLLPGQFLTEAQGVLTGGGGLFLWLGWGSRGHFKNLGVLQTCPRGGFFRT